MNRIYLLLILIGLCLPVYSQGVLISPTPGSPDPSAILELNDNTKGFLVTRMTTAQRNAIANPAEGLMIFNTTTKCYEGYFTSGWTQLACECTNPPQPPSSITGSATACINQNSVTYSTPPVPGASSYTWTVPTGATIVNGQGTGTITVNFGNQSGQVSVTANNGCGSSSPFSINVTVANPNPAFTVNPASPTINVPAVFTPAQGGANYQWTFQNGNPATSTAQNPSVTWGNAGSYTVKLIVTTNNGCVDSSIQTLTVINCLGNQSQNVPFSYTGAVQTWTVPSGVCNITIECWGAQGQGGNGGLGGYARGSLTVTPGQVLNIYVGGQNGYNGGGAGHANTPRNGGGASDVRINGQTLTDRIIVAGGGGASCGDGNYQGGHGGGGTTAPNYVGGGGGIGYGGNGGGGGANGGSGNTSCHSGGAGGGGFNSGGVGSCNTCYTNTCGQNGSLGIGGNGDNWENGTCYNSYGGTAGGGGGYYGGGGSSVGNCGAGGGGGGSSWTGTLTSPQFQGGVRSGNGQVIINY